MLSQVVFHGLHKWGPIARCGTTHLLSAAITTFFRFVETPQFDRAALLGERRRITHGYLHVFNLIGDPADHIRGDITRPKLAALWILESGQIFVFIDTEFVKILEIGILFFFCRHRNPILWYEISSCKMCSIRRNIKLQKHKPDYIRIWNRTNWSKT